jgi:hypothetical protein
LPPEEIVGSPVEEPESAATLNGAAARRRLDTRSPALRL